MSVSIADPNPTKRCTTTILSNKNALQSHNSASLTTTGDPPSPPSAHASSTTIDPERTARTIALFNIPDTINTARLQTLLSPYGEIEEISLRPHHQGAIIVFISATAAGTAALSMSGHEIAPGRKIRTGPISELYKQKADIKDTRPGVKKSTTNKPNQSKTAAATATATTSLKSASFMPNAGPIKRPGQAGTGRRGGLGQRRGVAISKGIGQGGTNEDPAEGKSNDEFRRMLVKSSEAGSETTAVGANIEVKR